MAQMYPHPLPVEVINDPGRAAERRVYRAFEAGLTPDHVVFYGVAWLSRCADGVHDGEADFIVAHPDRGILLFEVKGGAVARDRATGRWTSTDRGGRVHEIKDPVQQVRTSKYALLEKLHENRTWCGRRIDIGHAVAFPDCANPRRALAPDIPSDLVIFSEDFERADARIDELYDFWRERDRGFTAPGPALVAYLVRVLAPTFELHQPLGPVLIEEDRELIRLTEDQFRVLDRLSRERRVSISGGAGTGKTLLALEKAKRLAQEGLDVLLTCFNRPLADHLKKSSAGVEHLRVASFHQLCYQYATEAGIPLAPPGAEHRAPEYFDKTMPEALLKALDTIETRFDAIVVDEGQDFLESWWVPLQFCLTDSDRGILYVFHDDNQHIYRRVPTFPAGLVDIPLHENLRNTQHIHAAAQKYYRGPAMRALGPEGRKIEIVEVSEGGRLEHEVSRVLHRLAREECVAPDGIAVLTGGSLKQSPFAGKSCIGACAITEDQDAEPGKVLLQSLRRFKGLERQVVVLTDLECLTAEEADALLYVGLTRARTHLIIVSARPALMRLKLDQRD